MVVDPLVQMRKEVSALQQASGAVSARDLEVMMGAFAAQAPASTTASALEFTSGEMRLKGLNLKPDDIEAISFKLKPQAYTASAEGDGVVIRQVEAP